MASTQNGNAGDYFSRNLLVNTNGHSNSISTFSTPGVSPLALSAPKNENELDDDLLYDVDDGNDSDYDGDGLPFPKPIQRSSFSAPEVFDPNTFLVAQHRYQRLEDLHAQLSSWSDKLQKELIDLINRDYADFVGLGKSVSGGEEKVEDIKLVIIGFRREIEGISARLKEVVREMNELLRKKQQLREKENLGRSLIFCAQRVQALEYSLRLESSEELMGADEPDIISLPQLKTLSRDYLHLLHIFQNLPTAHPLLVTLKPRVSKVRTELMKLLKAGIKTQDPDGKLELLRCASSIIEFDKAVI